MTKTNGVEKDPLDDLNEVPSNWVTWGDPGDYIRGTLVDVREVDNRMPGKEGTKQKVYEILAEAGSFHDIDENKKVVKEATVIGKGTYWNVGGKPGVDAQFRNIKLGQIVGLRFDSEVPSKTKGYNPSKVIKVRTGGMDPNYTGQSSDMKDVDDNTVHAE